MQIQQQNSRKAWMKDNCMSIQSIRRKQTGRGRHLKPCTTCVFPQKTLLNGNKCISFRTMLHYRMVPLTVVYRNTSCWWSTEVWFLLFFKAHRHKGSTLHHQTGRTPAMAFSCNDNWKATVWPKGPNADHSGRIRLESPETWLRSYCSTLHHHSVFVTAPRAIVKPLKHIV